MFENFLVALHRTYTSSPSGVSGLRQIGHSVAQTLINAESTVKLQLASL